MSHTTWTKQRLAETVSSIRSGARLIGVKGTSWLPDGMLQDAIAAIVAKIDEKPTLDTTDTPSNGEVLTYDSSVGKYKPSAALTLTQGDVRYQRDLKTLNAQTYGASPSATAADNTTALAAWAAALQAQGGGIGVIPPGTYNFLPTLYTTGADPLTIYTFSDLSGIKIIAPGAVLNDTRSYATNEFSNLFWFTNCHDIELDIGEIISQESDIAATTGCTMFRFQEGCSNVRVNLNTTGGRMAVGMSRLTTDPETDRTRGVNLSIHSVGTFYPLQCAHSGDDVTAVIDAERAGRNYFAYGAKNHRVRVRSKNQRLSTIVGSYAAVENIDLDYYDRESDGTVSGFEAIYLSWRGTTAMTHRNIKIRLNLKNNSTAFLNGLAFLKQLDDGTTDNVARGHVLDGCEISGIGESRTGYRSIADYSTFGSPDLFRNCVVRDFNDVPADLSMRLPAGFIRHATGLATGFLQVGASSELLGRTSDGALYAQSGTGTGGFSGKSGANIAGNAYWDGAAWQRYDTAAAVARIVVDPATLDIYFRSAAAGANPITFSAANRIWHAGSFKGATVSADRGDASVTLAITDAPIQRFAATLTANRTVTLPTTGNFNGAHFRVVRTGLGAFTLDVGGLKTIPSATAAYVEVTHDGTAYRLTGYGTL